ncbi:MAG: bifunctional demethylmenaquinone methyltransferase/2-methoxy-6-polyprenyl-1,4-benzoquinol methylase UbiE [Deltaproteobacteria bacterium]|nr:bifunctional demethylmenaquinone methyltransferase/2-methoxy-6-polyprenyl-1,4-benzoquinol methylase UbiE [Deltaproteobacteria bacterium]
MSADSVREMFSSIAGRYDLANSVLSMGIHHSWRRKLISVVPADPSLSALDLCTGTGDLLPLLMERFGKVTGADFCLPMLEIARQKPSCKGASIVQADALNLPFADGSFDIVTVAFGVRNFADLDRGLAEIWRVLKPGGSMLILEFGQPKNRLFGWLYNCYCRYLMPLIGGALTGNRAAYQYLPETAKNFPCRQEFIAILERHGFQQCSFQSLTGGIAYCYQARK